LQRDTAVPHDALAAFAAAHRSTGQEFTMKLLLIPLAIVAGNALACQGDAMKDAKAAPAAKPAVAQKATAATAVASTKTVTKVSTKAQQEPRKVAGL
jgi:hypothetical protein